MSVRDGEPLDAAARAAVDASPQSAHEIERLQAMQRSLRELPQLEVPAGAWERILAAEQRVRTLRRRAVGAFAGLGAAAAIAVAALIYFVAAPSADNVRTVAASQWGNGPWRFDAAAKPATYADLVAESGRLERLLAELPPQAPAVRLGTMSTIVGLEDRIALVDEQLSYGDAVGLARPQRTALWSERVDLMSALVLVRAAEAQSNLFQPVAGETQ